MMALLAATLGLCASFAQAQATNSVYVIDGRGVKVNERYRPVLAHRLLDPGCCRYRCKRLQMRQGPDPERSLRAEGAAADKKTTIGGEKITVAADALFDFNKSTLRPEGKAKLDEVVAKAGALNLEVVIVVGHADRIGSAAYNQKLSVKRAASVKDYMVSKGIPANKVYTEGKGSSQPVTKPDQCKGGKSAKVIACLQPDRRVDIEIIGTGIVG